MSKESLWRQDGVYRLRMSTLQWMQHIPRKQTWPKSWIRVMLHCSKQDWLSGYFTRGMSAFPVPGKSTGGTSWTTISHLRILAETPKGQAVYFAWVATNQLRRVPNDAKWFCRILLSWCRRTMPHKMPEPRGRSHKAFTYGICRLPQSSPNCVVQEAPTDGWNECALGGIYCT